MERKEIGHNFLAKLGKTKLRPGGVEATNWLIEEAQIDSSKKILEVACNMGTTMIHLAKKYNCHIIGLDQSPQALKKAQANIDKEKLNDKLKVIQGNALKLPFDDNTFDIVINEAMLTMLVGKAKDKAIAEYFRVLKPKGILITHDVCILNSDKRTDILKGLQEAIHVKVEPLTISEWQAIFQDKGFAVTQKYGKMSLMNPVGMVRDEGVSGTFKIVKNGLKKENKEQFKQMFNYFKENQNDIGYIANVSRKKG